MTVTTEPYISNMAWTSFTIGDGSAVCRDANHAGTPININGRIFAKGVGTAAFPNTGTPADIVIDINGKGYQAFSAYVGQDNGCPSGTVNFEVLVDGVVKASSPVLRSTDSAYLLAADVSGGNTLTLRVWNGGDNNACDWADWGDAKLSSEPWTTRETSSPAGMTANVISVSPNPFKHQIVINMNNDALLRVFDLSGRCVADLSDQKHFRTVIWKPGKLASGIYLVRATAKGKVLNKVVFLQK